MNGSNKQIEWAAKILPQLVNVVAQFDVIIAYVKNSRPALECAIPALENAKKWLNEFDWQDEASLIIDLRDCQSPAAITEELSNEIGLKPSYDPTDRKIHQALGSLKSVCSIYRTDSGKIRELDLHNLTILQYQAADGVGTPENLIGFVGTNPENFALAKTKLARSGLAAYTTGA